jgi:hypothetical protein
VVYVKHSRERKENIRQKVNKEIWKGKGTKLRLIGRQTERRKDA